MTIQFLLDSNIISEPMKPSPNAKVMAKLSLHAGEMSTATMARAFVRVESTATIKETSKDRKISA